MVQHVHDMTKRRLFIIILCRVANHELIACFIICQHHSASLRTFCGLQVSPCMRSAIYKSCPFQKLQPNVGWFNIQHTWRFTILWFDQVLWALPLLYQEREGLTGVCILAAFELEASCCNFISENVIAHWLERVVVWWCNFARIRLTKEETKHFGKWNNSKIIVHD